MSSEVKPLLLRVAEACNEHEQFHKGRPYEEIIPNECQTAQLGLQKSLPRAEEEYGADANPHPLDVIHLCDFYRNILSGVFCPHAPQLFQWGNGGTKSKCRCESRWAADLILFVMLNLDFSFFAANVSFPPCHVLV
jgi:hypothetical protein